MARRRRARSALVAANYVRRRALNRGLLGESMLWRVVFYGLAARTIGRKVMGKDAEVLVSERLRPGQTIAFTAIDAKMRRRERAAARAAGMSRRAVRKI